MVYTMIDVNKLIFEVVDKRYGILLHIPILQLMTMGFKMPMKWILSEDTIFRVVEKEKA